RLPLRGTALRLRHTRGLRLGADAAVAERGRWPTAHAAHAKRLAGVRSRPATAVGAEPTRPPVRLSACAAPSRHTDTPPPRKHHATERTRGARDARRRNPGGLRPRMADLRLRR